VIENGTGEVMRNGLTAWEVRIALTFPVDPEDVKHRFAGDEEVDYAARAVARIRPHLEALLRTIGPGSGYFILGSGGQLARRCL
jgi:hypothetical protein